MERATTVVRGTHSANFYEVPMLSPSRAPAEQPAFASTWGPSSSAKSAARDIGFNNSGGVRRGTTPRDLNASFHRASPADASFSSSSASRASSRASSRTVNADEPQFQPAFAFDVNDLVSSLRRSSSTASSLSTSAGSASSSSSAAMGNSSLPRTASGHGWPSRFTQHSQHEQSAFGDARIETEPPLPRRGRRDALSGSENSQAQAPPQSNPNSIIAYSLNRRKKKPIVGMPTSAAPPSPAPGGAPHYSHSQHQQQHQPQHQPQYATPSSTSSRIPSPPPPVPSSSRPSHQQQQQHYQQEFRPTTTIITPNGIEYTTEVPTRSTRVTSFYEESFTF